MVILVLVVLEDKAVKAVKAVKASETEDAARWETKINHSSPQLSGQRPSTAELGTPKYCLHTRTLLRTKMSPQNNGDDRLAGHWQSLGEGSRREPSHQDALSKRTYLRTLKYLFCTHCNDSRRCLHLGGHLRHHSVRVVAMAHFLPAKSFYVDHHRSISHRAPQSTGSTSARTTHQQINGFGTRQPISNLFGGRFCR